MIPIIILVALFVLVAIWTSIELDPMETYDFLERNEDE